MSAKRSFIAVGVSAVLVAGGLTTWLVAHHDTSRSASAARPALLVANPFTTTVSIAGGTSALAGSTVHVRVAASEPIRTATLYDGSRVVGKARPAPGLPAVGFDVPAADLGTHAFTAHVTSLAGVGASSQPDPIVVARRRGQKQAYFAAHAGETATAAALRLGVPATLVRVVGHTIVEILPPGPLSPTAPAASSTTAGWHPEFTAFASGCTVRVMTVLTATLAVERASATDGGYVAAGSVTRGKPLELTDVPGGQLLLQARVHGDLTAVTSATLPEDCDPGVWTGNLSVRHGLLLLPTPAPAVYLYLGADQSRFVRMPIDPTQFIPAAARVTPIATDIPSLSGHHLVIEAWVPPDASSAHARLLARGELTVPASSSIDEAIGVASSIRLQHEGGMDSDGVVRIASATRDAGFIIRTDSSAPDHIAWQILQHPLTPANHDLLPFGLLKSGLAGVAKNYGTFHLAAQLIPHGVPLTNNTVYLRVIAFSGHNELGLVSTVLTLSLPALPVASNGDVYPRPYPRLSGLHVTFPHQPNPALINCIRITHVPGQPPSDPLTAEAIAFSFYPHPGTYCYNDFQHDDACGGWFDCAIDAIGSFVDGAVEVFAQLWDVISGFYNEVVNGVVKVLAAVASPFCHLAGQIDTTAGQDCGAATQLVSEAAVDAVLTFYGLPTHLPSSAELALIAKGDLTAIGTELLQQIGVPCDKLQLDPDTSADLHDLAGRLGVNLPPGDGVCQVLIGEILNSTRDQITADAQASLLTTDGLPDTILGIPGYAFVAEPKGLPQPITVRIDATGDWGAKTVPYACPVQLVDHGYEIYPYDTNATIQRPAGAGMNGPWSGTGVFAPNRGSSGWTDGSSEAKVTIIAEPDSGCMDGGPRHVTGFLRPYLER